MIKRIELPCYGIVVKCEDGVWSIEHELRETLSDDPEENESIQSFNDMMDGITSMIIAHAEAGVDISSLAYIQGIEASVEACGNYA